MSDITLYTINSAQGLTLQKKLKDNQLKFTTVTDRDVFFEKGLEQIPTLEIDEDRMGFLEALEWLKNYF